jgi:hypothetical protein
MADSSLPAILGLIGTLSGTVIGFVGALTSSLISERRRQAAEKKRRREEKLEELVTALCEDDQWVGLLETDLPLSQQQDRKPFSAVHLTKAEVIAKIYFPELVKPIAEWGSAAWNFEVRIALAAKSNNLSDLYSGNAYTKFRDARKLVWKAIQECIKREIG